MSTTHLDTAVRQALARLPGACDFADVRFYEDDATEDLLLYDGNLETNAARRERGIGVRVLAGGAWGFAATADVAALDACLHRALANARAATALPGFRKQLGAPRPVTGSYQSPVTRDPFAEPLRDKLALLASIDAALQAAHVTHRYVATTAQRRKVFYWNTEGTAIDRRQLNLFAEMLVMAPDAEGRTQRRSYELCGDGTGTRGYECLADWAQFGAHAETLKEELAQLLTAEKLAPGRRDVILLPGQGFLQVHETIGHALELDRILGYELSFAGGSHVRPAMIGTLSYGSEKLNCEAGATANSPGTFGFDDEGMPAAPTI